MPKHFTKPKERSEFGQVGWVFESIHCVDRFSWHLGKPWEDNMVEIVYVVSEDLAFLQIKRHIGVIQ